MKRGNVHSSNDKDLGDYSSSFLINAELKIYNKIRLVKGFVRYIWNKCPPEQTTLFSTIHKLNILNLPNRFEF